jgi:hypothetical protein
MDAMSDKKALVPVDCSPGSRPLKVSKYERYARYRAAALPRIEAYRKIGNEAALDKTAHNNATRLEKRPGVKERIAYLTKQAEERIAEKRSRIEERLWAIHEAAIGDYLEKHTVTKDDGTIITIERPKPITDLPREVQQNIEKISVSASGKLVPQLYSKIQASQELRKMLEIGRPDERTDVQRLSDAELVAQLRDQAKQLGVEINLNYSFLQPPKPER